MPDDITTSTTNAETANDQSGQAAAGETQAAQSSAAQFEYEAWLAQQPEAVRAGLEAHTSGLKSALEKERKANKKREEDAQRKADEAKNAELSDLQKAQKRLADLEKANADLQTAQRLSAAREALRLAAGKAKIEFVSATAEADALEFALKAATIGEDGTVENLDDVWKTIARDREYLIKRGATPAPQTNAGARGGSSTPVRSEDEKREFAAVYGVNPQYIK